MIAMPGSDLDLNSLTLKPASADAERTELGQEDFLMLMITQFQNQDPLQPTESGEFIGQMAQFSTVSGITEMNQSMKSLAESMYANQALQAATMVGRNVLASGDLASLADGGSISGAVELPYATGNGMVQIYDGAGQLVRQLSLGMRNAGLANFEWDGTLPSGETAPPGTYRIAAGIGDENAGQALSTYVSTPVQSVTLGAGGTSARITTAGGQQIGLADIKAIM
jgi:flagellar basal-body rod modification protein FlgD